MIVEGSNRFELLKLELQLLQQRLAKYDDLIWSVRSWAVTLTIALTSWGGTKLASPPATAWILRIAVAVPLLFWIEEGVLRASYVAKYIDRYRLLRAALNDTSSALEDVALYDLTSHFAGRSSRFLRVRRSFLRGEGMLLYFALASVPLLCVFMTS